MILQRTFRGGQLTNFSDQWEALRAPTQLIHLISGYRLPFKSRPPLRNIQLDIPLPLVTAVSANMSQIIKELLAKGIIAPSTSTKGFLSHMFIRLKSNGEPRPIFNLSLLNSYLKLRKFRLISHFRIPTFLLPGDFLATIDLSDAYCHVPIKDHHRRFLAFRFDGITYCWNCLPFGLASAPQAFSQLTNWVASILRSRGVRILVYLDDFLIAARSAAELQVHVRYAYDLLFRLGWQINVRKSQPIPSQIRLFLGLIWDTVNQRVFLPQDKRKRILAQIMPLLIRRQWSLRGQERIVGLLNFATFAVPLGKLYLRPLQLAAKPLSRSFPKRQGPIPLTALRTLKWWTQHLEEGFTFATPHSSIILSTDASDWGIGAHIGVSLKIQREWSPQERSWHINLRELFAIRWAFESRPHLFQNQAISVLSDNLVVLSLIRRQGTLRSPSLLQETSRLLHRVQALGSTIKAVRIPGVYNTLADRLSRNLAPPEWHLTSIATSQVFQRWGVPSVDLFASRESAIVPCYVTLDHLDDQALFVDALSREWKFDLAWVFPPPPLIPLVLQHLETASGTFLIVTPRWEKTFWRTTVKARAVDAPIKLSMLDQSLIDLSTGLPPPQVNNLRLEVWKVRGGMLSSRIAFHPVLSSSGLETFHVKNLSATLEEMEMLGRVPLSKFFSTESYRRRSVPRPPSLLLTPFASLHISTQICHLHLDQPRYCFYHLISPSGPENAKRYSGLLPQTRVSSNLGCEQTM